MVTGFTIKHCPNITGDLKSVHHARNALGTPFLTEHPSCSGHAPEARRQRIRGRHSRPSDHVFPMRLRPRVQHGKTGLPRQARSQVLRAA